MTSSELLIDVGDLHVGFQSRRNEPVVEVVHGVDFQISAGQCVAFVGESGSGKSVTARSLIGLAGDGAVTSAGRFLIGDEDAARFTPNQWRSIRGRFAGLVSQDALVSLDPLRTIGAELGEALSVDRRLPRRGRRPRAVQLLAEAGIPDPEARVDQYAHELSGGLRQRALIASAVASDPRLIIADEPTTALDVSVQAQVIALLKQRLEQGTAVLLISHDLAVVSGIADHVYVFKDGVVVESGATAEVLSAPTHEYTRRLLAAIPSARSRGTRLSGLPRAAAEEQATDAAPARTDAPQVVVEAVGVGKSFRRKSGTGRRELFRAVDDVSFRVRRGEVLGIVGESGSGKSTVANIVLGLLPPDTGEVLVDGHPWSALDERRRRPERLRLQLISQDPMSSFDPRYTVEEVVSESLAVSGLSASDKRDRIVEVLGQVELSPAFLGRNPRSLSGGQRQRVAIARALAPRPSVIVCDEPVSALDVSIQAQVLDLLSDLRELSGTALLFISHDLGVVHHLADRVVVMERGRIVEEGEVDEVFFRPRHPYTQQLIAALPALEASA